MRSVTTFDCLAFSTGVLTSLAEAAAEHPALAVYVLRLVLAVLAAVALSRPRAFAFVLKDGTIENRLDRRLLLGAVMVMWSVIWPVTLAVLAIRIVRGRL